MSHPLRFAGLILRSLKSPLIMKIKHLFTDKIDDFPYTPERRGALSSKDWKKVAKKVQVYDVHEEDGVQDPRKCVQSCRPVTARI